MRLQPILLLCAGLVMLAAAAVAPRASNAELRQKVVDAERALPLLGLAAKKKP